MIIDNPTPIPKAPIDLGLQKLLADIQGNILKSHGKKNVKLLFIQFGEQTEQVREWIRTSIFPLVSSMTEQLKDHQRNKTERVSDFKFCSFSISSAGYKKLLDTSGLGDGSFNNGMSIETIPNDPPKDAWESNYRALIDAVLILAHDDPGILRRFSDSIEASMRSVVSVIGEEDGQGLPGEKEHFGFADGVSQPRFFAEDVTEDGTTVNWDPSASLNLVLTKDPHGKAFNGGFTGQGDSPVDDFSGTHSYGSYLVFRKLEQDVDGWNDAVKNVAGKSGLNPELVGAFAVGRFQDGTPVVAHAAPSGAFPIENDFDYVSDMAGSKCPFSAHIRKTNPRGGTTIFPGVTLEEEKKKRIARRGIPYESNGTKGLLFMCYQSSIIDQFEFMQNSWVDNKDFLHPNTGVDDVIGQGMPTTHPWPTSHGGPPSSQPFTFGQFVTMRGGEYFFTPSISFLKTI